jgi:hypothetical protein
MKGVRGVYRVLFAIAEMCPSCSSFIVPSNDTCVCLSVLDLKHATTQQTNNPTPSLTRGEIWRTAAAASGNNTAGRGEQKTTRRQQKSLTGRL